MTGLGSLSGGGFVVSNSVFDGSLIEMEVLRQFSEGFTRFVPTSQNFHEHAGICSNWCARANIQIEHDQRVWVLAHREHAERESLIVTDKSLQVRIEKVESNLTKP